MLDYKEEANDSLDEEEEGATKNDGRESSNRTISKHVEATPLMRLYVIGIRNAITVYNPPFHVVSH